MAGIKLIILFIILFILDVLMWMSIGTWLWYIFLILVIIDLIVIWKL